jgi:hypothetical protein
MNVGTGCGLNGVGEGDWYGLPDGHGVLGLGSV